MNDLKDKHIWVLGGAGYLGSAITRALDTAGAKTLCADRPGFASKLVNAENLSHTTAEDFDLFDLEAIPKRVAELTARHGVPDGLVNLLNPPSAGKKITETAIEDFRWSMDGTLTAGFLLAREVAEKMKVEGRRGSLVFFSSMYGMVSWMVAGRHGDL
ncbi:MAG: SDR family NAD(P)-dependent oxidoreductase [Chthoniobacterales bacterium]